MPDLPYLVLQDKLDVIKSDQDILIKEVVPDGHPDDNPPLAPLSSGSTFSRRNTRWLFGQSLIAQSH